MRAGCRVQVQGELALFLARCACLNVEDWGSTNDKILRDSKFVTHKHDLEDKAVGGGAVVLGLVRLVAERTHRRAKYHAALCLANLADDVMRTVPPCVLLPCSGAVSNPSLCTHGRRLTHTCRWRGVRPCESWQDGVRWRGACDGGGAQERADASFACATMHARVEGRRQLPHA